jgi:ADP-heptose:LPS heptosyltransferase
MSRLKALFILMLRTLRLTSPRPDTFLIPAYAGLGNFIMATPMVLELKRRMPQARIYILTWPTYGTDQVFDAPTLNPQNFTDAEPNSPVEGIFLLDPATSFWSKALFFLRLRRWRLSVGFIPFDACPGFVWWGFRLAGITTIAAHSMEFFGSRGSWIEKVPDITSPLEIGSHESDIHLDLLDSYSRASRIPIPADRNYQTQMAASAPEELLNFGLQSGGYIVVQISVANARFPTPKIWDRDNWADLIRRLQQEGETVVIPGDENEAPLVVEFIASHKFKRVINIAGRTSVRQISMVIKHAKLLVVHDSGLMHIGNAHGTPLVALYGPTDWNFTMPKAPTSRILRKNLPCQPCMARMAKTEQEALRDCKIHMKCMRDITVDEVHRTCVGKRTPLAAGFVENNSSKRI